MSEPSWSALSTGHPGGCNAGKHVGEANSTEPSGWIVPRETEANSSERATMTSSPVLLRKSASSVFAEPMNVPSTVPPQIRLPGGQAATARSASSRSLAVQRPGTLVSKRMPGGQ